jgi:hypothetical protein
MVLFVPKLKPQTIVDRCASHLYLVHDVMMSVQLIVRGFVLWNCRIPPALVFCCVTAPAHRHIQCLKALCGFAKVNSTPSHTGTPHRRTMHHIPSPHACPASRLIALLYSDAEPTIRCNATIAVAKCANYLPEAVRDKVVASSMQKARASTLLTLYTRAYSCSRR